MITWVKNLWRQVRRDAVIEQLTRELDALRRRVPDLEALNRELAADAALARASVSPITLERDQLRRLINCYLAGTPAIKDPPKWTADDAKSLGAFLEDSITGKKVALFLTDRLGEYEYAAIIKSTNDTAALLLKRAHGFRDCRAELLRLSAAGPTPANHNTEEVALPSELEFLRA